ncbi:MAG TPA: 50S ribosomal protein L11 methyltransferase, partial [Bacteroidetes bacterium]|nr:50S ribosomal protein L11 methyltransferase [Bacteroidota bacterium]
GTGVVREKDFIIKKFENKDWNKEWEKTIEPVNIKNKIIITPSWKKDTITDTENKIIIEIDPKMSFGTGHNETTQIMLEMMIENLEITDKKILDFGSGTGVLAIAAQKLGADKIVAIDNDDDAVENAKEYFEINHTTDIKLLKSELKELNDSGFDVILANIIRTVILENLSDMNFKLNSNGKLFLSGILKIEDKDISDALHENGFEILKKYYKSEWIGIYAIKIEQDSSN